MFAGVVLWGGFNWSLEVTNTEKFCISCHEMRDNVYQELQKTVHFTNRSGVRATCPDCHVPKEWIYKVARKIRASGELYHWMRGTVATREKFTKRRPILASHVWETMRKSDSKECRNCHKNSSMRHKAQKPRAAKMHQLGRKWGYTCIDCHKGIAHQLPGNYDKGEIWDELHARFDSEKTVCRDCHTDMAGKPKGDDGWAKE
jgi:cytochrome c-type protein NapC